MKKYNFKKDILNKFHEAFNSKKERESLLQRLGNLQKEYSFENVYTSFSCCPDNYIGEIGGEKYITAMDNRYNAKKENNKHLQVGKPGERNIIILLQSAHIDEFKKNLTAPALGETGDKLNSHLEDLLKK